MSAFGYWTFSGKNGLTGAPSTVRTLPDGRKILVKDPEYPAVLEDDFIIFALKNSRVARTQFNNLYPSLDAVSKSRLTTLLAKNGSVKRSLDNPFFSQSAQDKSDEIQANQVVPTRPSENGSNSYLEIPRKNRNPRSYPTPSAPTIDSVVSGDGQAVVTFTANSRPITNYQYTTDGGRTWTSADGANSPLTIRPLANGGTYNIQIRPLNLAGAGEASENFTASPSTTPSKPTLTLIEEGDEEVTVGVQPGSDGGRPITDYEYTLDGGLNWVSTGSTASPLVISSLTNGVTYNIQVRPVNSNGPGEPSDPLTATPYARVPLAPNIVSLTTDDLSATLLFTSAGDGGSPITDFQYSLDGEAWVSLGASANRIFFPAQTVVQFGTATSGIPAVPSSVLDNEIVQVAAGNNFALALDADGRVWAWGDNSSGQTTVPAGALSGVTKITAGHSFAYVLKADGSVLGWGDSTNSRFNYAGLTGIVDLVSGWFETLFIDSTGAVHRRGSSTGVTFNVSGWSSGVTSVGASRYNLIANQNGAAKVTGHANHQALVVPTAAQSGVVSVQSDGGSTLWAVKGDGTIIGWGKADSGQMLGLHNFIQTGVLAGVTSTYVPGASASGLLTISDSGGSISGLVPTQNYLSAILTADGALYAFGIGGLSTMTFPASASSEVIQAAFGGDFCEMLKPGPLDVGPHSLSIRAVNANGVGPATTANFTSTTTASKPTVDSVTTGDGELVVAITAGADGGDPVTDYEYTVDGGLNWISIGSAVSPLTISPLTNGVSYTVQVRPVNGNGAGEPSDPFAGTPSTVPGQPTISGITTGDQELTVSVTGDNGGSAITDYEYSLNGGPFISAGTAVSPFTISGLTNGVSYDVVVQAVNANGTGTPSAATTATPSTVPAQPTIDSITAGDEELTVAFTAGDDGGSALTDIEYTLDGTNYISAGTTTSPFTITGLTNGQTYPVQIRPVNANGTGTPSTVTNATPEGVPSTAPTIDSFSTGDGTVTINFTPGDDGGSAITDYEYTLDGGLNYISAGTAVSPVVVSGLTNGTEYDIEIRPVNANGAGPDSTTVTATPSTVPDAPTLDSLTVGDEQLTVAFTSGGSGGSVITDIEYRIDGGVYVSAGTTTSPFVISGLTNGTEYDVEIRAVNANGSSAASNLLSATPATTPAAPTISGITTGDEQLTVAFTAGSDGGSAITDYEYSLDGGAFVSAGTTTSPFTIAGLNNGQTYSVVIRAVNAEGNGASSVADTGTPSTVPEAPTLDSLTSGSTELEAAFTLNGTGGSPITDVEYRLNSGAWVSFGSTTSPQTITGLTNGVAYTVEVRAVNANGASPASNSLTETPAASWEPTDVNTVAWVDASDTSSYTLSGSTLTAVTDKAGTYTLSVGGTPTRVAGGLNSLNVFDFDGSGEYIQSTAYRTQVSSGNHWAIGVFRPDVSDSTQDSLWSYETANNPKRDYAVSSGNTGSWPGELDLDALSSNRISSTIGNLQAWNLQSLSLGSWAIVVTYFNKTGNQIGCRKNGNNCFTPVNDYTNSLQASQELRLMRNRASQELDGRLAEFFAVADLPGTGGTDLSDVEKAEGYLAWKWGLVSLLPSGHPYKTSPP